MAGRIPPASWAAPVRQLEIEPGRQLGATLLAQSRFALDQGKVVPLTDSARAIAAGPGGQAVLDAVEALGRIVRQRELEAGAPPASGLLGVSFAHDLEGYTANTLASLVEAVPDWRAGAGNAEAAEGIAARMAAYLGRSGNLAMSNANAVAGWVNLNPEASRRFVEQFTRADLGLADETGRWLANGIAVDDPARRLLELDSSLVGKLSHELEHLITPVDIGKSALIRADEPIAQVASRLGDAPAELARLTGLRYDAGAEGSQSYDWVSMLLTQALARKGIDVTLPEHALGARRFLQGRPVQDVLRELKLDPDMNPSFA